MHIKRCEIHYYRPTVAWPCNTIECKILAFVCWYYCRGRLQADNTMLVIRSRRYRHRRHIHLKTSLSFQAPGHRLQIPWSSSTRRVLMACPCIASWIDKETLLTPAKIHRLAVKLAVMLSEMYFLFALAEMHGACQLHCEGCCHSIVMWVKTGKLCNLSPENGQLSIEVKHKIISDASFCRWKFMLHHLFKPSFIFMQWCLPAFETQKLDTF